MPDHHRRQCEKESESLEKQACWSGYATMEDQKPTSPLRSPEEPEE